MNIKKIIFIVSWVFLAAALVLMAIPGGVPITRHNGDGEIIFEKSASYFTAFAKTYDAIPALLTSVCSLGWLSLSVAKFVQKNDFKKIETLSVLILCFSAVAAFFAGLAWLFSDYGALNIAIAILVAIAAAMQYAAIFIPEKAVA